MLVKWRTVIYYLVSCLLFELIFRVIQFLMLTEVIDRNTHTSLDPKPVHYVQHSSSTWGPRKHLSSIKTKLSNRLNLESVMIFAFTKIRPRIDVLACQKQTRLSH
jgi:hypothetical protein